MVGKMSMLYFCTAQLRLILEYFWEIISFSFLEATSESKYREHYHH